MFISIKDKWNPYCSKWGYCISYDAHGANGPGQSKGAVEDGQRGQCRSSSDCTPHAPNCSPEGYCSQGVFLDIKSNAVKNDEYYGKIEDDNRLGHVDSRKEDPLFQQRPDLLANVEAVENTVYQPCTYCKYDPDPASPSAQIPIDQNKIVTSPLDSNAAIYRGSKPLYDIDEETQQIDQPTLVQQPITYNNVENDQAVFGIGSGYLQDQHSVLHDTISNEVPSPGHSFEQNRPQIKTIPQNRPVNAYNAVPAVPKQPVSISKPGVPGVPGVPGIRRVPSTSQETKSQPIPSLSQDKPIAIPAVHSEAAPDLSYHSNSQIPSIIAKPAVPYTQPTTAYNDVPTFPVAPALNTIAQTPKQGELPLSNTEQVPPPTYSVQTQINAFNPFQSPQYQTGQATSIHQQLPTQQQAGSFYNTGSYPFYQYPAWNINPYRYFFG